MKNRIVYILVMIGALYLVSAVEVKAVLPKEGIVVSVYDGDTFTIKANNQKWECRIVGIDAPEVKYGKIIKETEKISKYLKDKEFIDCIGARAKLLELSKITEGYGKKSKEILTDLILGKTVKLQFDKNQKELDRYVRLLVYCYIDDTDAGRYMIDKGYAIWDDRFEFEKKDEYKKLTEEKQKNKVGMWK